MNYIFARLECPLSFPAINSSELFRHVSTGPREQYSLHDISIPRPFRCKDWASEVSDIVSKDLPQESLIIMRGSDSRSPATQPALGNLVIHQLVEHTIDPNVLQGCGVWARQTLSLEVPKSSFEGFPPSVALELSMSQVAKSSSLQIRAGQLR